MIAEHTYETRSVAPGSDHHVEKPVPTFIEIFSSLMNPLFTNPLYQPLIDPSSMRYIDSYSSYRLRPGSTTTLVFGTNPSSFGFPEGLGNSYFSTTHVVDIVGASSLPEISLTQLTLNRPLVHSSPFSHESGNILASLFLHIHTPSSLLGRSISQMVSIQVINTTMISQDTQPPSHTS
jgi:hypothetical protein